VILEQYYLGCLAHASYLVGDEHAGEAAVVDPQRDVEQYLEDADRLGVRIGHVFLTHFHADFVAGHLELRERTGAAIHLGARAKAEYEFAPMGDGDPIELGAVRLVVLETPGHSPESISIVVYDTERDPEQPFAVLTGDTLFIGDVGRPDLRGSLGWSAEQLGSMLYDSLHGKLAKLPDDALVYPAHGAGSLCGKHLSTDTVSTIGVQRAYNYALQPMSRARFIELVTADQPDAPDYFTYDAVLNTREHPTLEQALARELRPLTVEQALELALDGAQLLDTRGAAQFEGAHLTGSVNIGLGGSFATWCGTLLDQERPIVVVADPGRETEAATRLGRIGFDNVAGYLEGGMETVGDELVERTERITAGSLKEQLKISQPPLVVDVRAPGEWQASHIEQAVNLPLSRLPQELERVPGDRPVVVYCASGYRSSIAASVLCRAGRTGVTDLVGGLSAWEASEAAA
jgi:glyoxylase-like metal-dependent hydrolase (beta-lactamase superfamily II)/rhodanese-related sulfurtransferase